MHISLFLRARRVEALHATLSESTKVQHCHIYQSFPLDLTWFKIIRLRSELPCCIPSSKHCLTLRVGEKMTGINSKKNRAFFFQHYLLPWKQILDQQTSLTYFFPQITVAFSNGKNIANVDMGKETVRFTKEHPSFFTSFFSHCNNSSSFAKSPTSEQRLCSYTTIESV